jgi:hypothetical protein
MTDSAPLPADEIDELLSAELDGEFDAAARGLGYEPAAARARLAAVHGVGERRAALAGARDALAQAPPIDELAAARLQSKALTAWAEQREEREAFRRGSRRHRMYTIAGGVAAAVAVIAGLSIFAFNPNDKSEHSAAKSSAAARPTTEAATRTTTIELDFGAASDLAGLVARARSTSAAAGATAGDDTNDFVPASGPESQRLKRALAPAHKCDSDAGQLSQLAAPTIRGAATLAGEPVFVYVYRTSADEIVLVLTGDCRLLTQQTGPAHSG